MSTVRALFAGLPVTIEGPDVEVRSLAYDSRRVTAGACFASLPGARADGHQFIPQALERGAESVLCERPVEVRGKTRVLTADARATLAEAARRFFGDPAAALAMVGVTGTNGKTTTSHLIAAVLEAAGKRCGIIGTLGVRFGEGYTQTGMTTPESLDLVAILADLKTRGAGGVAMEVSSHALVLHRASGVAFDAGVFTNLTHDHLDFHGTMEAYFEAKSRLFSQRLKPGGRAVLNLDDPWVKRLVTPSAVTFSAGGDEAAAVRVASMRLLSDGTHLTLATPRGELSLRSPLVGRFNVENLLAAVGVGEALGLPHAAVVAGLSSCAAVPGRLERVSRAGEPLVVVDYAHTPDALEKALKAVREVTQGRVLCVFGCGGDRDPHKRPKMGAVAASGADWALVTSDNPRSEAPATIALAIEQGLLQAGAHAAPAPGPGYAVELDRARAIEQAVLAAGPRDAVLIAGKGHETYQIIGSETRHFDDREVGRAALDTWIAREGA